MRSFYTERSEIRPAQSSILRGLRRAAGGRQVLTGAAARPYSMGFRSGGGRVAAAVRPRSLVALWRTVQACVDAGAIVIMQAANTGLTGGSTPDGDAYDRPVVVISTGRLKAIHLLDGGRQVVCLPGTTLHALEDKLRPLGREPHSVIGSSCMGASVVGGICNNSGGALVRRGPAYTELALFARLDADGALRLVNHLGIDLPGDPETMLAQVERGSFAPDAIDKDPKGQASDHGYHAHVRDVEAASPARFNADPTRLKEASGSAGRLIVFAVRLDTFAADADTATFYLGTNDPGEFTALRRHVLTRFTELPVAGEYIHRDAFDLAAQYGKDIVWAIEHLGTARLPALFRWKRRLDDFAERIGAGGNASERLLQRFSRWLPSPIPRRLADFRDRYEHHLILKVAGSGISEARAHLHSIWPSPWGGFFECNANEAGRAFLQRFAVAGAAVRYGAVHRETERIVALDIALPRNTLDWFERLPASIETSITHKLYYGHFFCHVFHQDYIVREGHDVSALKREMLALLDQRQAKYPAEHNVGHLYDAPPGLAQFYRDLDPRNQFNAGIGRTSKLQGWAERSHPRLPV